MYRVQLQVNDAQVQRFRELNLKVGQVVEPILRDATNLVKQYAVQNLSGVPFASETGTHIINKRTGRGAASIQVQLPYGSPYKARLFAYAATQQYGGNPETYNYLKILETGRGEVKPKYTPSMKAGRNDRARIVIPGGSHELVFGVNGFRGATGRYRFLKSLPPMEGKYWLKSAKQQAEPEMQNIVQNHIQNLLDSSR